MRVHIADYGVSGCFDFHMGFCSNRINVDLTLSSSSQSWRCLHFCMLPRNCAICIPCFRFGQMIISRAGDPYLSLEQKQGIFFASSPPLLSALLSCIGSRALPSLGFLNRVDSRSPQQDTNLSFSQSRKMSTVGPWMRAMNRAASTTPESCSDHINHGDRPLPLIPLILILKHVSGVNRQLSAPRHRHLSSAEAPTSGAERAACQNKDHPLGHWHLSDSGHRRSLSLRDGR